MYARYCCSHPSGARCALHLQQYGLPLASSLSSSAFQARRYCINGSPQSERGRLLSSSKLLVARSMIRACGVGTCVGAALGEQRRFIATSEGKEGNTAENKNIDPKNQESREVTKEEDHSRAAEISSSFLIESMFADAKSEQADTSTGNSLSLPPASTSVCSDDAKRDNDVSAVTVDPQILSAAEANSHNTRLSSTIEMIHDVATYVRDKTNVIRATAAHKIRPSQEEMIKTALREHRRYQRKVAHATRISRRKAQAARQSNAHRDRLIEQMGAFSAAVEKDDADSHIAAKSLGKISAERKRAWAAKKRQGGEQGASGVSAEEQFASGNLHAPSNRGADNEAPHQNKSADKNATKPRRKQKLSAKRRTLLIKKLVARIESRKCATKKTSPKTKDTPKKKGGLTTKKRKVCESRAMHDPTDPNSLPPTMAATVMSVIHEAVEEAIEAAASHSPMRNISTSSSGTVTKDATIEKPCDETAPPKIENEETAK